MQQFTQPIKVWLIASRPRTLIASLSPVLLGSSFALRGGNFSFFIFFLTLLFGLLIQIGTNLANDYFDFIKGSDTEKRVGPTRVMQAKLVTSPSIKTAIFLVFTLSFIIGIFLLAIGGVWIFLLAISAIILGLLYTAGPYPLAYLGLGDIFVLIFFGPVATLGTYWLQMHELSLPCFFAGFGPGFFSCAILTVNNLRDINEDERANKKTLVVRFGKTWAKLEYTFSIMASLMIPVILFFYGYTSRISFLNIALFLLLLEPLQSVFFNNLVSETLSKTTHVMTLYSFIFCISVLL